MKKNGVDYKVVILVVFTIMIITIVPAYFFLYFKNCDDEACFNNALKECSKTKFKKNNNNNIFEYKIKGTSKNLCQLEIKVLSISELSSTELESLFEGKSMNCKLPRENLNSLDDVNNILDFCSGTLKEAMLELVLNRIYDLSVKQIGDVIFEIESKLNK